MASTQRNESILLVNVAVTLRKLALGEADVDVDVDVDPMVVEAVDHIVVEAAAEDVTVIKDVAGKVASRLMEIPSMESIYLTPTDICLMMK